MLQRAEDTSLRMSNVVHGYVEGQASAKVEDAAGTAGGDALAESVAKRKVVRNLILEEALALCERGKEEHVYSLIEL